MIHNNHTGQPGDRIRSRRLSDTAKRDQAPGGFLVESSRIKQLKYNTGLQVNASLSSTQQC